MKGKLAKTVVFSVVVMALLLGCEDVWHPAKDNPNPSPTPPGGETPSATTPSAPTGFSAAITSGTQIRLSWNAVSGATGYKVYCIHNVYENEVIINGASASGTTYNWTGDRGWIYTFWVTAVNSVGEGPASSRVKLTMPQ